MSLTRATAVSVISAKVQIAFCGGVRHEFLAGALGYRERPHKIETGVYQTLRRERRPLRPETLKNRADPRLVDVSKLA